MKDGLNLCESVAAGLVSRKPDHIRLGANAHIQRNMGIDILRGLLVLAVMAYHFTIRWAPPDYPLNLFHFGGTYGRGWSLGAFGVHVFFVISGYVITLSVLRSRSAPRFAMGRFLRIYPPYVLAVLLSFAVPWLLGPVSLRSSLADLGGTLLMLPRELQLRYTDGAFWTLTVEAKFYFFVFLGYLGLRERFWLVLVALGWIGPLVLLVAGRGRQIADRTLRRPVPFRHDGLVSVQSARPHRRAGARQRRRLCLCHGRPRNPG